MTYGRWAVGDLARYVGRTGRWWFPLVVVILAITVAVIAAGQAVVPTAVYTLF